MAEEEMQRIFKRFDANGDGKISPAELADALRTIGSTATEEIQKRMGEIDTDGDGFIDYDEFVAFGKANPELAKVVAKAFKD